MSSSIRLEILKVMQEVLDDQEGCTIDNEYGTRVISYDDFRHSVRKKIEEEVERDDDWF